MNESFGSKLAGDALGDFDCSSESYGDDDGGSWSLLLLATHSDAGRAVLMR